MAENPKYGSRVRALRRKRGLSQKKLAGRLDISPSYLNLIEHDKRPLSAPLLIKLATLFELNLNAFSLDDQAALVAETMEIMGDPVFDDFELTQQDVREFTRGNDNVARAFIALYRAFRESRSSSENLAAHLQHSGEVLNSPEEEVSDLVQRHRNYFPELEEAAEKLWRDGKLDVTSRFSSMVAYLDRKHGIRVELMPIGAENNALRSFDKERRLLRLSEQLPPRSLHFQLAIQIGFLGCGHIFERLLGDNRLSTDASRSLARIVLANYFAGAVLMPYEDFLKTAKAHKYDVELIGHRFRTSYEQVAQRLTSMRRPGLEGIPLHLIRVDIAGNISKRFSGSGIQFARYSGACPIWNVHSAFLTPGSTRTQLSRMPDGHKYFCWAKTVRKDFGGFQPTPHVHAIGLGCRVEHADQIVYSDGLDLVSDDPVLEVGVTCRLCDRTDCRQRAFPSLQRPLSIDENRRGFNFYSPPED